MNTTLIKLLEQLTPSVESRDPVARMIAVRQLDELAIHMGFTQQEVVNARKPLAVSAKAAVKAEVKKQEAEKPEKKTLFVGEVEYDRDMKVFGPRLWDWWHRRALHNPDLNDMAIVMKIFTALPCGECKGHYLQNIEDNPPVFGSKDFNYFAWTVQLHNAVNKQLGKPIMSWQEAEQLYK